MVGAHPLAGLRPIRLRLKHVVVRVVVLARLVAQDVEGLQGQGQYTGLHIASILLGVSKELLDFVSPPFPWLILTIGAAT